MYDQNDYIVYQDGIARVIEVENNQVIIEDYISQEIKNINHHHIIRKICSLETIKDILERIEFIRTVYAPQKKVLEELYQEAMMKYDELEWVKVIKSVYVREKMKKAYSFERAYRIQAEHFLNSEISILLQIPEEEVNQYIINSIHQNG